MAEFPTLTRGSRSARALLLAFAAASLITLPAQLAQAQVPPVQDCVTNPASCLPNTPAPPPLPEVDKCVSNPASCLPEVEEQPLPEVDKCISNPASCLPDTPPVDQCTKDPASCLPKDAPDPEECVKDVSGCLPDREDIDRCAENPARCVQPGENENRDDDDDNEGGAAPVEGNQPPRQSPDATARTQGTSDTLAGVESAEASAATPDEGGTEIGTAAFASNDGSTLEKIQRGLADAAQRFAFPLAVAALVGAFLLVQGHIDRKDPKLAAAPIISQDDLVSFR